MAISPLNPNNVFCAGNVYNSGYFIGVSHSSDGGASWDHDTLAQGTRGWAVAFDGVDTNRVYVGGDSAYSYPALLISTDLGETWTMSRTGLNGAVNVLLTIPGNGELVYAGTGNGLFRSTDAGVTWSTTPLTQQVRTLVADPLHPANLFAGTYSAGVYTSTDGGTTWTQMNTGLTCLNVMSLAIRPGTENTLLAGTEGGSVFKTTVMTGITDGSPTVNRTSAIAVSPNPSHGRSCIDFTVPEPSLVRAAVYDYSGRIVADLGSKLLPAGAATWQIDTKGIPAGTYFVRLTGLAKTLTARLTVIN